MDLPYPNFSEFRAACLTEVEQKLSRLYAMMDRESVQGLRISRVANFSWVTGGLGDNHIVITSEVGAVDLLLMRDGTRYAVASNSEMPRMMAEDLRGLGYEPCVFPWHDGARGEEIPQELAAGNALGSDLPREGYRHLESALVELRTPLTDNEIGKYRWLCWQTARAVEEVCRELMPGLTERQVEARASDALMSRGIRPTVLLIGTDRRIFQFRHAPPTDQASLVDYGMVNVCARRWGLVAAVTRFVHFGPVPAELQARLQVAASVNARLQDATRAGVTSGELLEMARGFYAEGGYPEEWRQHHQGGAISYGERDWVLSLGGLQKVVDRQAFAYNPTVQGAKVEDTALLLDGNMESLTRTGEWPEVVTEAGGRAYDSPAILELPRP